MKDVEEQDPLRWVALRDSVKKHLDSVKEESESYNDVIARKFRIKPRRKNGSASA